ncbi:scopoletin glucosyltransferase-like [Phalaenopsis equestris]|uniref:scopoletin glucosyltransferase-like n=1 Tax=Phalaenopsis equestris TaxID=78828 RepID=UPI0009E6020F|nr:scopoletin glucosyltransferase-like [Phalaenopsis equestris]
MDTANSRETTQQPPLRGFIFPLLSPGHMIPLIDIAKLLSRRDVSPTIITTPGNESLARPAIDRANSDSSPTVSLPIDLILLPFPPSATDLLPPGNRENLTKLPPFHFSHLMAAIPTLRPSLHDLLCVHESLALINPLEHFSKDDARSILIDDLPYPIELTKPEIHEIFNFQPTLQLFREAEEKSFGVVVNSFYELEPAYVDIFRSGRAGRRAWFVGPVSLSNPEDDKIDSSNRGSQAHLDTAPLLSWLDAQPARSVVYTCFGSLCQFDAAQMRETAIGLEASGQRFIWAVRDWQGAAAETMEWLPEGFEERVEGKGWVVRGWAPQIAILGHVAVGAFVTHCGWNSTLEGLAAGLPLVAWPLMYEQFVNERLITEVLKVGVRVRKGAADVKAAEVAGAVRRVMADGEEAEGFRRRARELAASATRRQLWRWVGVRTRMLGGWWRN